VTKTTGVRINNIIFSKYTFTLFKKKLKYFYKYISIIINRETNKSKSKIMASPSLFIPHVFPNISEARIRRIFDELALGDISRIDMVERTNERGPYKRVYIHFSRWYRNEDAETAREKLLDGKEIKIVYDEPWFWKISANRTREHSSSEEKKKKKINKPRLVMSDEDEDTEEKTLRKPILRRQTNIEETK
jgi:hypothetical protein